MKHTTALAAIGLTGGVAVVALRRLGDFDLPWHLAAGRAMVTTRRLLTVDDFSYTFRGARVAYEALADVALYASWRIGGELGLHALTLLLCGGLAALFVARAAPAPRPIGIAFSALALMATGPWIVLRPALFSFVLFAAALFLVDRHRQTGRSSYLFSSVALQLVWANVHGSAVLGAALAVLYASYLAACRLGRGRLGDWLPREEGRCRVAVLALCGLIVVATLLGPFGLDMFTLPFRVRELRGHVTEWMPLSLSFLMEHDVSAVALAALALATIGLRIAAPRRLGTRGMSVLDLALLLGTAYLAVGSARLVPLFAAVAGPLVARQLGPLLVTEPWHVVLVLASGLLAGPVLWVAPHAKPGIGFDRAHLPEGAVRFIEEHRFVGPGWNFLSFGGYLTWRLYPDVRVFIDGRTVRLFPLDFLGDYERGEHDRATFRRLAERYHFEWAIVRSRAGERFSQPIADDPSWAMVYLDDTAALYVRRGGPNDALAVEGYRVLRHLTPPGLLLARLSPNHRQERAATVLADLAHDADLAIRQAPISPRAHFFNAALAIGRHDRRLLREERDRIEALDPEYPGRLLLELVLSEKEEKRHLR